MKTALAKIIDLPQNEKEKRGLLYTPSEIYHQVGLWLDTFSRFRKNLDRIRSFIDNFKRQSGASCILTGAGTSEFIGYCVEGLFRKNLGMQVNVFSTTKIVTNPLDIFVKGYPTLLVSFARSGNSPESVGAVQIADTVSDKISHLVITCNNKGSLIKAAEKMENCISFCLNEHTNDRGLAMTSSFSNMVIAAQMLAFTFQFNQYAEDITQIAQGGKNFLTAAPDIIEEVCGLDFNRVLFLGSGSNYGTAVESHLKLQELTSGRVMCAYDTFPGLRHGPEAVIDENTLITTFLSNDQYTRKYEEDLLAEIRKKKLGRAIFVCCDRIDDRIRTLSDFAIEYNPDRELHIKDDLTPPIFIIAGQLLGLFKSLALGLKPDSPSESGIIHRVVKGVKVYDYREYCSTGNFRVIAER